MLSNDKIPKDPIIEQIKVLYDLGEGGQYEIIHRTISIFKPMFILGKPSKELVDRMMDKGVKPLELGIALAVSITETDDKYLSPTDREIKKKILETSQNMLADWKKLVELNE